MAFSAVKGQTQIKIRLAAEAQRRGSGAYMLTGPEGTGKRMLAEEFAKALMCPDAGSDGACGVCPNCKYFDNFTTPDVTRVYEPSDTKNVKVDFIKDRVVAESYLKPQFARTKTFIIDFDYLGEESQNALLKSLEEPRKDVVFILTSSNTDAVLDTVMSRVTEIKLDTYSEDELEEIVRLNFPDLEEEKVKSAVYNSGRIPGKAIELAREDSGVSIRHEINKIMTAMPGSSYIDVLEDFCEVLTGFKDDSKIIASSILLFLDDAARLINYPGCRRINNELDREAIENFVAVNKHITTLKLGRCTDAVKAFTRALEVNANFDAAASAMLLRIHEELKK
ncbi:DNA polymerase III subunit [Butyrivibrio sp. AE2032]|uniref:DNA polymerase III subunit n=1 Tax=Butyrivibrio sp. AE2032 TaxID=1458463 RepID=UPI000689B10A|nr:ATP-binding protein [Butyrivibrio sp. AE2032]